jgi:hypothetical protein
MSEPEDAIVVVRCASADVAAVRSAVHAAAETQDVVFRRRRSPHNHGVNLYPFLTRYLDLILRRAKAARRG